MTVAVASGELAGVPVGSPCGVVVVGDKSETSKGVMIEVMVEVIGMIGRIGVEMVGDTHEVTAESDTGANHSAAHLCGITAVAAVAHPGGGVVAIVEAGSGMLLCMAVGGQGVSVRITNGGAARAMIPAGRDQQQHAKVGASVEVCS